MKKTKDKKKIHTYMCIRSIYYIIRSRWIHSVVYSISSIFHTQPPHQSHRRDNTNTVPTFSWCRFFHTPATRGLTKVASSTTARAVKASGAARSAGRTNLREIAEEEEEAVEEEEGGVEAEGMGDCATGIRNRASS